MTEPPSGEYVLFDTVITGSGGRLSCTLPEEKKLPVGIYPVKLVVRCVKRQTRNLVCLRVIREYP